MFQALGLTEVESVVYLALIRHGPCSPGQVATLVARGGSEVEQAAADLAVKGLLTRSEGEPPRLLPSPPDVAGELLLHGRMRELQTARAALGRLSEEYRSAGASQIPVEFTPAEAVPQRISQIQRGARREVLMFDMPPYVATGLPNHTELERLRAGVAYRTLYDRTALELDGWTERVRPYVEAGEQARIAPRLPLKMVVADRERALVPGATDGRLGSLLIHPGPLLEALISLFEALWQTALPIDPTAEPTGHLGSGESQLLTLLLSGVTDEVIARRLGVGKRTVLRRVRALTERAGVTTRMQLAWHAARHGWLDTGAPADAGARAQARPGDDSGPRLT